MYILYLILALAILLMMVTIHEFGHYCAGKFLHFKINEFSIGFGKSLFSHKSKKTGEMFSIRLIPLGGYCAFEDEDGLENSQSSGAFNKQAPWKRLIVLFSGAFFNVLSGVLFSIVLLCATGYDVPQIVSVETVPVVITESSTALTKEDKLLSIDGFAVSDQSVVNITSTISSAIETNNLEQKTTYNVVFVHNGETQTGTISVEYKNNSSVLKKGDVLIAVNGTKVDFAKDHTFSEMIQNAKGDTATLTIKNGKEKRDVVIQLFDYGIQSNAKVIGVKLEAYKYTFGESLARCVPFTFGLAYKVLQSLWQLITGQLGLSAVGGPLTTITQIATFTQSNFASFFILLPLIAVNLGVFNWLPIPALDGSKMVFTLIEWIRGKPINPKVENAIHNIGFIVLMGLVVIADIYHLLFV